MEPTLVYVTLTISGILFTAPEPVPMETCQELRNVNATVLCIDKEPDCGKHAGVDPCLGRADLEPTVKKPPRKRTYTRRRVVRR